MVREKSDLMVDFSRRRGLPGSSRALAGQGAGRSESRRVTLPETLDRAEHIELHKRQLEPRIRFAVLLVIAAIIVAGLLNVFGQSPGTRTAAGEAAELRVSAPMAARGGLIYEARFEVEARRDLNQPAFVLDPGWFDGLTINTFQPDPTDWEQRNGRNVLIYGPVEAGQKLVVRLQYQVNPTAVGRRDQDVVLEDSGEVLAVVDRSATLYP
jgi:hypothetical protein